MTTEPVWQHGVRAPSWEGPVPARADAVVIGGGFTGLSAALSLAEAGASVLLLEAGRLARGASGRNGGQVLTGLNASLADLERAYSRTAAVALYETALAATRYVAERIRHHAIACDWHQGGHIEAARTHRHLERLRRDGEALASLLGRRVVMLDAQAVAERTGSGAYVGGLYDPSSASVDPYRLALGFAEAAAAAGATLREGVAVAAVEPGRASFTVMHGRGQTVTPVVVLAVNAHAAHLMPGFVRHIWPIRSAVIATDPLPPARAEAILPGRPVLFEDAPTYFYAQRTSANRIVFGGRTEHRDPPRVYQELRQALVQLFPMLEGVAVTHGWQGRIALSADALPHLGRTRAGVYYALGYSGHGVALSLWCGHLLAEAVVRSAPLGILAELPFPTFRRGRPTRRHRLPTSPLVRPATPT